jgi:periplasmic protein TonB
MNQTWPELYSPQEIARAVGVTVEQVFSALGRQPQFVRHDEAVRVGRAILRQSHQGVREKIARPVAQEPLFAAIDRSGTSGPRGLSLALSSTAHAGLVGAILFLTSLSLTPAATTMQDQPPPEQVHLVFLTTPGPGGGGGGGGLLQPKPAPKILKTGKARVSSPLPVRQPPKPIEPVPTPPEPTPPPPLQSEPLPVLVAPIISAPADMQDRIGVPEATTAQAESHGPGKGGGAGTGDGVGLGSGSGPGIGPGTGGGTGGGPYRAGSGIVAPRLLREVKADYTEDARRRGVEGEVLLEIVITRNGSVGDVKVLRRLDSGLDQRAIQAVRQWQFAPATRQGAPVDVIVEVGVEFRLR